MNSNFLIKLAIQYNRLMHDNSTRYSPSPELGNLVNNTLPIFINTLPNDCNQKTITDIGSGVGKWTVILSHYFSLVHSYEPQSKCIELQKNLIECLKIANIKIQKQWMPDCIQNIETDGVFFAESLYLSNNWHDVLQTVVKNNSITYVSIIDGPDEKDFDGFFHQPYIDGSRLPLVSGNEFTIKNILENSNFKCKLFDILSEKETTNPSKRWFLTGHR